MTSTDATQDTPALRQFQWGSGCAPKARPWVDSLGSCKTGQNTQPPFFKNKVCVASLAPASHTTNAAPTTAPELGAGGVGKVRSKGRSQTYWHLADPASLNTPLIIVSFLLDFKSSVSVGPDGFFQLNYCICGGTDFQGSWLPDMNISQWFLYCSISLERILQLDSVNSHACLHSHASICCYKFLSFWLFSYYWIILHSHIDLGFFYYCWVWTLAEWVSELFLQTVISFDH